MDSYNAFKICSRLVWNERPMSVLYISGYIPSCCFIPKRRIQTTKSWNEINPCRIINRSHQLVQIIIILVQPCGNDDYATQLISCPVDCCSSAFYGSFKGINRSTIIGTLVKNGSQQTFFYYSKVLSNVRKKKKSGTICIFTLTLANIFIYVQLPKNTMTDCCSHLISQHTVNRYPFKWANCYITKMFP